VEIERKREEGGRKKRRLRKGISPYRAITGDHSVTAWITANYLKAMEIDCDFSLSRFIQMYGDTGNIEYRGKYFDTEI